VNAASRFSAASTCQAPAVSWSCLPCWCYLVEPRPLVCLQLHLVAISTTHSTTGACTSLCSRQSTTSCPAASSTSSSNRILQRSIGKLAADYYRAFSKSHESSLSAALRSVTPWIILTGHRPMYSSDFGTDMGPQHPDFTPFPSTSFGQADTAGSSAAGQATTKVTEKETAGASSRTGMCCELNSGPEYSRLNRVL